MRALLASLLSLLAIACGPRSPRDALPVEAAAPTAQERLGQARALFDEGRSLAALTVLEEAEGEGAGEPGWDRLRYEIFAELGWQPEAREALIRAIGREPDDCQLRGWWLEAAWEALLLRGEPSPAELARGCPELRLLRADLLRRAGRAEAAVALLRDLVGATTEGHAARRALAEALALAGDLPGAIAELSALVDDEPGDGQTRARLAALHVRQGTVGEAQRLRAALLREAAPSAELRRQLLLLEPEPFWAPWSLDDAAWRRAAREESLHFAPGADGVIVLDQQVSRFFPDGGGLHYSHALILVGSARGAERFGELFVPPEAELLFARTLKPDGRQVEPEDIPEKESLSMPALEPGDLIDAAWLSATPPRAHVAPDLLSETFFLESYQAPILRSEWTAITPAELSLAIESNGRVDSAQRLLEGGLVARTWRRERSLQQRHEPHVPDARETLAFVRLGSLSWEDITARLSDALAPLLQVGPELQRHGARLRTQHRAPRERARAAFALVQEAIDEDTASFLESGAERAFAEAKGERSVALLALLRALGIPARLYLVQPAHRTRPEGLVPDLMAYSYPVVRALLPEETVWLEPSLGAVPFGYLPPSLQGRPALAVSEGEGPPRDRTPELGLAAERREIDLRLRLDDEGLVLRGEARDRIRGVLALNLRALLAGASEEQRRALVSSLARAVVPTARLGSLRLEGLEDPEQALSLDYTWEAPLTRPPVPGPPQEIRLGLFAERFAEDWATLPWRRHPLLFNVALDQRIDISLALPPGASLVEIPPGSSFVSPFGRHSLRVDVEGREGASGLRVHKELTTGLRVVSPGEYPDFARMCRHVDRADELRLRLRWRRAIRAVEVLEEGSSAARSPRRGRRGR